MTSELRPCPFCNGHNVLLVTDRVEMMWTVWLVYCRDCELSVGKFDTAEDAAEAWNRRHD